MIFATYQPLNPIPKPDSFKDITYGQLEFNPVWCINADTLYDFWINSVLAVPVCPEKLIVFETDEYWAIDKTDWYQALHENGKLPEVISKEKIDNVNRVEFLVRKIENVLYEVDIKDSIYGRSSQKEIDEELEPRVKECIKDLKKWYDPEKSKITLERYMQNNVAGYYKNIYVEWNQYAIEDYRSNLHKRYDIEINTNYISKNDKLYDLLDNYNSDKASIKLYYDIKSELDKAITKKKIYPNNPCPCGSGKKYKKCCMNK